MRRLHVVVPLAFLSMILATSAFAQGRGGGFRGGFGFGGFRRTFFGRGFGRGFGFGFGFGFGYPLSYLSLLPILRMRSLTLPIARLGVTQHRMVHT